MSTIKTNNVQIGQSLTASQNFTLYQPAIPDGTVRLGNGNAGSVTDLVTLTSAGNLGIGTSSPLAKTNVVSTGAALGGTAQLAIGSGTNNYENTYLRIDNSGNSNFCIDQIVGGTSLNRLFIERTTGNVGIGTSSPAQKLHLSAAGNLFAQFSDTTNSVTAYAGIYNAVQWIGTSTSHPITFNTANTERMRLDTSGNLGLGVTPKAWSSAYRAIEIGYAGNAIFASTSSAQLQFSSNAYFDGAWKYAANGTASNFLMLGGEYRWNIASNNLSGAGAALTFTQAMTLDASGRLGINNTSPQFFLEVDQNTASSSPNKNSGIQVYTRGYNGGGSYYGGIGFAMREHTNGYWGCGIQAIDDTNNYGAGLAFSTSTGSATPTSTERMRIASSGIVTMFAYGAGAATFSAAGVISSVSDETWKTKDGVPFDTDAMLKKLEPGYWYYNDEKKEIFGVDRQLGFYAQNVNAAIGPEAAPEPEEGKPWGYYDRSVLAVVVMSLQKALSTIESLEARIAALESN